MPRSRPRRRSRLPRVALLTPLLLLLCGGVSLGGVRVGGSGGAAVGYWEVASFCNGSGSRVRNYHEVPSGEAHVDYEVPQVPGLAIGGAGGFRLVEQHEETEDLTARGSTWVPSDNVTIRMRTRQFWGGVRVSYADEGIDALGMAGFALRHTTAAPDDASQLAARASPRWHPVAEGRIALGPRGYVAYESRFRIWGEELSSGFGGSHGIRILGGDLPALWLAFDIGAPWKDVVPAFAWGLSAPRHWPVQPSAQARYGSARNWQFSVGVDVLIGDPVRARTLAPPGF